MIALVRRWILSRVFGGELDAPLAVAVALFLLANSTVGVELSSASSAWWWLVWLGPVLYLSLWAVVGSAVHRQTVWSAMLPVAAFAGVWWVESEFGRWAGAPWWLTHALIAVALLGVAWWLTPGSSFVTVRVKVAWLAALCAVCPFVAGTTAARFWRDCRSLRLGSDVAAVFEVLEDHYVFVPETPDGEYCVPIRDQSPAAWSGAEFLTIGTADFDADITWLRFENGRLTSARLSPD